jgi:DNA mismatch endonuclease (patch repair protein)
VTDTVSRKRRSEIMAKIHEPTRLDFAVRDWLTERNIVHEAYPGIEGRPDFRLFAQGRALCVFVDGCFWHCCPEHYKRPKSRQEYWIGHLERANRRRERARKDLPYAWVRVWGHDVKSGRFKRLIEEALKK